MKPRRALLLYFEEGETITGEGVRERLDTGQYALIERPSVMRDPCRLRHLWGVIAMPNDALEQDKRRRAAAIRAREPEAMSTTKETGSSVA